MGPRGPLADPEFVSDRSVVRAAPEEQEDLALTRREAIEDLVRFTLVASAVEEIVEERTDEVRRDHHLPRCTARTQSIRSASAASFER